MPSKHVLKIALLNTRSTRNKTTKITDYIDDYKLDILCMTETWLESNDQIACAKLTPEGYIALNTSPVVRGHRVGVIFRHGLNVKIQDTGMHTSFECMMLIVTSGSKTTRLVIIYRPRGKSIPTFLDEFAILLDKLRIG